ncbi:MAG: UDP-N-acetylmuramoyl-L-alanine--D-glutamate ligase [Planctomycetota bacterium]
MDYAGRRVTVMGLGRFGGGVGVTQFLSSRGAAVTVTDIASADELSESVARVRELPQVTLVLGEHREQDFRDCDLVVANPAVKPDHTYLQIARDAGVPVTTEICLLVRELPNRLRTIGVTGSAGKSTTTAMVGHILRKAFAQEGETPDVSGDQPGVWVGGNLGGSLLPLVDQIRDDDWVVLELSSFMLHYLREEKWSPHIAAVTNLSPNHLDWHGTFEEYAFSKRALLDFQVYGDFAFADESAMGVYARRDSYGHLVWPPKSDVSGAVVLPPGPDDGVHDVCHLPGSHNVQNAALSLAVAEYALNTSCSGEWSSEDSESIGQALEEFTGLPHRLAFAGTLAAVEEVRCFNDSKSTTPEAAVLGMEAFEPGRVHVILGGYDKGADLSAMCRVAVARCAGVYGIGATGAGIVEAVMAAARPHGRSPWASGGAVVDCGTLANAMAAIRRNVKRGEVVLLSPGCASWDQFANYEERGERFIALVRGE